MFDPQLVRRDFPLLARQVHGKPLVYLDSAATSQKPQVVIDAITDYYQHHNANVHRGVHQLSDESTQLFESSHQAIAEFFGAKREELILTPNTTAATNGVAYAWGDAQLKAGDTIVATLMEHHSNLVVWQELCRRTGAQLKLVGVDDEGRLFLNELEQLVHLPGVRLIVLPHVSNTLGTINPLSEIVGRIRQSQQPSQPIRILVDGAQAAPHLPVNFTDLDVDFFVFSGHKMLGPMGSGGLLVKRELLVSEECKPWLFGGGMIARVFTDHTEYQEDICERFIAGTPDVAATVGLAAACAYLSDLGMTQVFEHDQNLVRYALQRLGEVPEVRLIGPQVSSDVDAFNAGQVDRSGSVAFIYAGVHAHDVAQILDSEGVAVRSGHHCTMPLHQHFEWQATVRASFNVYSSRQDIDALVVALEKVKKVFQVKSHD